MIPILFEKNQKFFTHQGLGPLKETTKCEVFEKKNGEFTLELAYPRNGKMVKKLKLRRIILAKPNGRDEPHAFRIFDIDMDSSDSEIIIHATTITNDLAQNVVKLAKVFQSDAQGALSILKNNLVYPTHFSLRSNIQLVKSTEWEHRNPLNAIVGEEGSIVHLWGGEIKRENDTIWVYSRRGRDNVTMIRLEKNIKGLQITESFEDRYTSILPYSDWEEEVVDKTETADNQNEGPVYTGERISRRTYGNIVYSKYHDPEVPVIRLVQFQPPDREDPPYDTPEKINQVAANYFTHKNPGADIPKYEVRANLLQLSESSLYDDRFKVLEQVNLWDTVDAYIPEWDINRELMITSIKYDSLRERTISIEAHSLGKTGSSSLADDMSKQYTDMSKKFKEMEQQLAEHKNGIFNVIMDSANGRNKIFSGRAEPPTNGSKVGDVWFKEVEEGKIEIWIFDGQNWIKKASEDMGKQLEQEIANLRSEIETRTNAADVARQAAIDDIRRTAGLAKTTAEQATTDARNAQTSASQAATQASQAIRDAQSKSQQALSEATRLINAAKGELNQTIASTALSESNKAYARAEALINSTKSIIDSRTNSMTETYTRQYNELTGKFSDYATKTVVDGLSGTIRNHTTALERTAQELSLKMGRTDVDNLVNSKGYATTTSVNALIKVSADAIRQEVSRVSNSIPRDVSYRNWVLDSDQSLKSARGYNNLNKSFSMAPGFWEELNKTRVMTISVDVVGYLEDPPPGDTNRWHRAGVEYQNIFSHYPGVWHTDKVIEKNGRIYKTIRLPDDMDVSTINKPLPMYIQGFGDITVSRPKVTLGELNTDWSPAPEDAESLISSLTTRIEQNERGWQATNTNISNMQGKLAAHTTTLENIDGTIRTQANRMVLEELNKTTSGTIGSKINDIINGKGYQTASQVNGIVDGKGYQTASQVNSIIDGKGYQTSAMVDRLITAKNYLTQAQVDLRATSIYDTKVVQTERGIETKITEMKTLISKNLEGRNYAVNTMYDKTIVDRSYENGVVSGSTKFNVHELYATHNNQTLGQLGFSIGDTYAIMFNIWYGAGTSDRFDNYRIEGYKSTGYDHAVQRFDKHPVNDMNSEFFGTFTISSLEHLKVSNWRMRIDNTNRTFYIKRFRVFKVHGPIVNGDLNHKDSPPKQAWQPAWEDFVSETKFSETKDTVDMYRKVLGSTNENGIVNKINELVMTNAGTIQTIADYSNMSDNLLVDSMNFRIHRTNLAGLPAADVPRIQAANYTPTGSVGYGYMHIRKQGTNTTTSPWIMAPLYIPKIYQGETYTITLELWMSSDFNGYGYIAISYKRSGWKYGGSSIYFNGTTSYQKGQWNTVTKTFTASETLEGLNDINTGGLCFWHNSNVGSAEIRKIAIRRGDKVLPYSPNPDDDHYIRTGEIKSEQQATQTEVSNLAGSWAVKNLTNTGTILNQLNLNRDGTVKIDGKLVQITGQTYIEDGVIGDAKIGSLSVSKVTGIDATYLQARIGTLDVGKISGITSEFITGKIDTAIVNLLRGKVIVAQNNAMNIDLNKGHITFRHGSAHGDAPGIEFDSPDSVIFRKRGTHTGFLQFANEVNGGVYAGLGVTSSGDGVKSQSAGRYSGVRIFRTSSGGTYSTQHLAVVDEIQLYGDTVKLRHGFDNQYGWDFPTSGMGITVNAWQLHNAVVAISNMIGHMHNVGFLPFGNNDFKNAFKNNYNQLHGHYRWNRTQYYW